MKDHNHTGIIGEITANVYRPSKEDKAYNTILRAMVAWGILSRGMLATLYRKGELVEHHYTKNLITTAGRSVPAAILNGSYMDTGELTHMALGDGVGTPNVSDTELFNEVYRNVKASSIANNNVVIATAFYTEAEVDGTFTEFGNFIDGTPSPDTGVLWSHINVNWTKTDQEVLTVQCKYTFTNG